MIKVYIAGPFFNEHQLDEIKKIEKILEDNDIPYHSPRSVGVLKDMEPELRMLAMKKIFDSNLKEMDGCTHMVACMEGRDTGTLVEFGYFLKSSKPVVLYAPEIKMVSVMLAQGASSIITNVTDIRRALFDKYSEKVGDTI